jgi:hypothetical protein
LVGSYKTGQYYLRSQSVDNKAKHLAIDMDTVKVENQLTVSLSVLLFIIIYKKIDKIGPIIGSFFITIFTYKNKILLYLSNKEGMAKYININYPFKDK